METENVSYRANKRLNMAQNVFMASFVFLITVYRIKRKYRVSRKSNMCVDTHFAFSPDIRCCYNYLNKYTLKSSLFDGTPYADERVRMCLV